MKKQPLYQELHFKYLECLVKMIYQTKMTQTFRQMNFNLILIDLTQRHCQLLLTRLRKYYQTELINRVLGLPFPFMLKSHPVL